jgi:hypothetical protein
VVLKPAVRQFASNAWATRRGLATPFDPQAEAELAFDCDRSACSPRYGVSPALGAWWSRRPVPPDRLTALCGASDILVVRGPAPAPGACPTALVLTQADFLRGGSAEIFAEPLGWRVAWAQTERGLRPWSQPAAGSADRGEIRPAGSNPTGPAPPGATPSRPTEGIGPADLKPGEPSVADRAGVSDSGG